MNTVEQLLSKPFSQLKHEEILELKMLGPHRPEIKIEQMARDRGKDYIRSFSSVWYGRKKWLTGSTANKSLYCFPCLIFGGDVSWTKTGVNDIKHLTEKMKSHESSRPHLLNSLKLAIYGTTNVAVQLEGSFCGERKKQNEQVDKNRYILSKIIDSIRLCGAFELALCAQDKSFSNPAGIGRSVNFFSSIDCEIETHLKTVTLFTGSSKKFQDDLLDCMLDVTRRFIMQQIKSTEFVAIQADVAKDVSAFAQSALFYRYIDGHDNVVERFYGFIRVKDSSADMFAEALLAEVNRAFPECCDKEKVIAQSYDSASIVLWMPGEVQSKVCAFYPNAHYVYCYAHRLDVIIEQVVSKIYLVGLFFCNVSGFHSFFSHSSKITDILQHMVANKHAKMTPSCWNFHSQAVQTIYLYRDSLLQCLQLIETCGTFDPITVREAWGLLRILEDREFLFFLFLFNDIMSHVTTLHSQLIKASIDTNAVQNATTDFVSLINQVRESIERLDSKLPVECRFANQRIDIKTLNKIANEICDIIVSHVKTCFAFTSYVASSYLLQSDLFEKHELDFPVVALYETTNAYPMLNRERLRTELTVIYGQREFRCASGIMALFRLFIENNLQETFPEIVKLLRILITTPVITTESERCLSTASRIKTFLSNTINQDRLNALAMLSLEKQLIESIPDFNKKTIETFSALKDWHIKFLYE